MADYRTEHEDEGGGGEALTQKELESEPGMGSMQSQANLVVLLFQKIYNDICNVRMTMVELSVKSMCDYDRAQGCDYLLPHIFALILRTVKVS